MARRLLVIALSEASPVLLERLVAAGELPHLAALLRGGAVGRTRYAAPYLLTPQMWATILTGRSAGAHGVFDYWQRGRDGRFREMRGGDIRGPRLETALADAGVPAGFVNVPMTYPPQTVGFTIAGQDAPGAFPGMAYPRALYRDLVRRFGRHHHKDIFPGREGREAYARTLPREVDRQGEVFEWIAREQDWRFLLLYSSGTAFAQHYFWADMDDPASPYRAVVEETYRATDRLVGRLAETLDEDDGLIVFSECGAGPIAQGVRLNRWLEQEGFLARTRRTPSWRARRLADVRREAPRLLPKWALHLANRRAIKSLVQGTIVEDGIDWRRTRAFHRGKGEGAIYLTTPPGQPEHRRDLDLITERLLRLIDPSTGLAPVKAVHRREDLYAGEHVAEAPDLIVEWRDFAYMPSEDLAPSAGVFGPRIREYMTWPTSGSHRPEGVFLARGLGGPGRIAQTLDLMDLAPTWLDLLGAPAPPWMEGRSRRPDLAGRAVVGAG